MDIREAKTINDCAKMAWAALRNRTLGLDAWILAFANINPARAETAMEWIENDIVNEHGTTRTFETISGMPIRQLHQEIIDYLWPKKHPKP